MPNDDDKQKSDKPFFLTGDKNITEDEIDHVTKGEGYKVTPQQLMELAKMAKRTYDIFEQDIKPLMNAPRAQRIKELRKYSSWREVAATTYQEWGDDACWGPPSNQLAGMVLTKLAAQTLGENEDDWSSREQGN